LYATQIVLLRGGNHFISQARDDNVICTAGRDCWLRQFKLGTAADGTLECTCISMERASVKVPWIADIKMSGGLGGALFVLFCSEFITYL
jgi:hypothetical protein